MIQWRRHRLWLALALAAMLLSVIAVAALWLPRVFPNGSSLSPLPADQLVPEIGASPLHTPTPLSTSTDVPPSWTGAGAALLWAALGFVLALTIAFIFVRRYHPAE